jgi:hypothetical protein
MKTNDLIAALAADTRSVSEPIGRTMWLAAAAGAAVAMIYFLIDVGLRPDLATAVATPRFIFKYVFTLTLLVSAMGLLLHLARPGTMPLGWLMALVAAPVLLALAAMAELFVLPASEWMQRLVGTNALFCLVLIPSLSAAPLVALILALRQGAPTHPVLAGATAGLVSAAIGATLYASHCRDDSPLFLAVWYVIAVAIMTAVGALLGARLLRW